MENFYYDNHKIMCTLYLPNLNNLIQNIYSSSKFEYVMMDHSKNALAQLNHIFHNAYY